MFEKVMLVALGGGLGAIARYAISIGAARLFGERFPIGTLLVNLAGCFLIGLVFALGMERNAASPNFRLFFITGFLGALTTFSSFGLESVNLARTGMQGSFLLNVAVNNIGGVMMVLLGLWSSRLV